MPSPAQQLSQLQSLVLHALPAAGAALVVRFFFVCLALLACVLAARKGARLPALVFAFFRFVQNGGLLLSAAALFGSAAASEAVADEITRCQFATEPRPHGLVALAMLVFLATNVKLIPTIVAYCGVIAFAHRSPLAGLGVSSALLEAHFPTSTAGAVAASLANACVAGLAVVHFRACDGHAFADSVLFGLGLVLASKWWLYAAARALRIVSSASSK